MFTGGGTVVARYDYDPFGRSTTVLGTTPTDFNFTGLYRHARSNLDLATYRSYDPDLGRWMNRDPIASGSPFFGLNPSPRRPQAQIGELFVGANLYEYVDNNPTAEVDLLGLTPDAPTYTYICQAVDQMGKPVITLPPYRSSKCDRAGADDCCQCAIRALEAYISLVRVGALWSYNDSGNRQSCLFHGGR
jgi:RHS repeat-associated protein